jgi:peptide/nickel transport system permease protein
MTAYIIRRLIQAAIVLIIVTVIVFFAMRLLPGDPILMFVSWEQAAELAEEQMAVIRHDLGLDRPLAVQYFDWLYGVIRGDLGISVVNRTSVAAEIVRRVPITAHLGVLALIICLIIGIPAGIISAVRRGGWLDTVVTSLANIGITVPIFWLGIVLMYTFALELGWLPVFGYTSPFEDFWMSTKQLILPVFCLAIMPVAGVARQTRSSMLEVLQQDYIRTAWSKGLRERLVIARHALKNALIPVVTLVGLQLSMIIGGSVLIEQVFNIPGMGRLAVQSIMIKDYGYVQGVTLVIAVAVVLINLAVDLSYGWLDPRIRYR